MIEFKNKTIIEHRIQPNQTKTATVSRRQRGVNLFRGQKLLHKNFFVNIIKNNTIPYLFLFNLSMAWVNSYEWLSNVTIGWLAHGNRRGCLSNRLPAFVRFRR